MRDILLEGRRVDLDARSIQCDDGRTLSLTALETRLLRFLADRQGRTVERDELLVEVWGHRTPVVTRCVDSAIRRLRTKLEVTPSNPRHLLKAHGHGYRLDVVGRAGPATPPQVTDLDEGPRLFGRTGEIERIGRALDAGYRRILLRGLPGSGRTAVLEEAGRRFGGRYTGGAWRSPPQADGSARLVLVDAGETLPTDPQATVIGVDALFDDAFEVGIGSLSPADAIALLRHRAGREDVDLVADRLGGHPGALLEAAQALAVHGPDAVAARGLAGLPHTRQKLLDAHRDLEHGEAASALCVFPSGFSMEDAAVVIGMPLPESLVAEGWVEPVEGGYRVPPVVRAILSAPETVQGRFCALVLTRLGEDESPSSWPDVEAAVEDASASDDRPMAIRLLVAANHHAQRAERHDWLRDWYRRLGPDHVDLPPLAACRWLRLCGELDRLDGRTALARRHLEGAHDIATREALPVELAMTTGYLAIQAHTELDHARAEELYRQGARLCAEAGLERYEKNLRGNLGRMLSEAGRVTESEPLLRDVLISRLRDRDPSGVGRARMDLAWCLCQLGHGSEARHQLDGVLSSDREFLWSNAATQHGLLAAEARDLAGARRWFERGISEAKRLNQDRDLAILAGYLALLDWWTGDIAGARAGFRRSIERHQHTDQTHLAAVALLWLSALERHTGDAREADAIRRRASQALQEHGAEWRVASQVSQICDAIAALPDRAAAKALVAQAQDSHSLEFRVGLAFLDTLRR